jgi:2-iminobutanoate/2-iminopropanoate deaminase
MREIVSSPRIPKAIGPYSQAVKANGFIFVSGQLPIHVETGALVAGDAAQQTQIVLENLKAILEAAGSSLSKTVKTTLYLTDMNDFPMVNEIYGTFFPSAPPARATVEVARLPKDVRIEIDLIALS